MVDQVFWHGTHEESNDLVNAIAKNCGCSFGVMGVRTSTCPAHDMLVHDQRALDGLVYERRWMTMHRPGAGLRVVRPA